MSWHRDTRGLWCPCFQAYQPDNGEGCPAYPCPENEYLSERFGGLLRSRHSCLECLGDWISKHHTLFPGHRIETSDLCYDTDQFLPSRSTERLTRRVVGW